MQFSANIGFLYADMPIPQRIRAAKADGFDAVECHFPYEFDAGEVADVLAETGLPMLGLNTRPGESFGYLAMPGQEIEARAAIDEAVAYGARIGAGAVHVMAGRSGGGTAAERVYRENLAYACDKAGAAGTTVLIEPINHRDAPGYHLYTVEHGAEIIGGIGAENLRLMFDCYHTQIMQGDLLTRFAEAQAVIGHVQIAAVPDRGEPEGGEVHYINLLTAFARLGWSAPVGAEYRPRSGKTADGLSWLADFRAALK